MTKTKSQKKMTVKADIHLIPYSNVVIFLSVQIGFFFVVFFTSLKVFDPQNKCFEGLKTVNHKAVIGFISYICDFNCICFILCLMV